MDTVSVHGFSVLERPSDVKGNQLVKRFNAL